MGKFQSIDGITRYSIFFLFLGKFVTGQPQTLDRKFCDTYTVNPGDSALTIAQSFGLDYDVLVNALKDCVGYEDGNVLQIGQKICIPPYSTSCNFVTTVGENAAYFAELNGFNLTDTVEPLMKLALPPWNQDCPQDILSKPSQANQSQDCKMYISSGGETLNDIASKLTLQESDLVYFNAEYQNGERTEPGAQIKLTSWGAKCSENAVVVNRPSPAESIVDPVEVDSSDVTVGSPSILPLESPIDVPTEETLPLTQLDEDFDRVVLDLYLKGLTNKEFSENEYNFRENLAQSADVPIQHVDVRFTLSVENFHNRKLLAEKFLQVNTAIFGDKSNIYQNLNQSIQNGDFLLDMAEDNFDVVYVAVMQPMDATLYDVRLEDDQQTENGSSLPLPLGALVGIAAGVAIILVILVVFCCIKSSQKKKKALEAAREETRHKKKMDKNLISTEHKGAAGRKEFRLEAFASKTQHSLSIPPSGKSTMTFSHGDILPQVCNEGLRVSPETFINTPSRYIDGDTKRMQTRECIDVPCLEREDDPRVSGGRSTKGEVSQSPQKKFNKRNLSKYIELFKRHCEYQAKQFPLTLHVMRSSAVLVFALFGATGAFAQTSVCPTYVVQQGDSPYSIAQKFDILQDDLKNAMLACGQNNELLQIGQEICLPGADKPGCANVQSFNNDDSCKVYIVQQGDTIESVALALNIYRDTLNSLNTDVMGPGGILQPQKFLKLPPWSNTCGDPNKSGEACRVYIVQQGDFIAGIAAAYGITVDELLSVNPALNANTVLQNGQPIKIPPFPASCGAGTPSKPPTNTVLKCRGYRIQQGDSINDVAKAFKTTYNDVLAVNPELAGGALVQPGTIILIPPYDNTCEKPILVEFPDDTPSAPSTGSGVQIPVPATPVPITPVPLPVPIPSPIPVPTPSPPLPSPSPAVPVSTAPSPAPLSSPSPVVVTVAPEVSTAPAPGPESSSRAVNLFMSAAAGFLTFLLA